MNSRVRIGDAVRLLAEGVWGARRHRVDATQCEASRGVQLLVGTTLPERRSLMVPTMRVQAMLQADRRCRA